MSEGSQAVTMAGACRITNLKAHVISTVDAQTTFLPAEGPALDWMRLMATRQFSDLAFLGVHEDQGLPGAIVLMQKPQFQLACLWQKQVSTTTKGQKPFPTQPSCLLGPVRRVLLQKPSPKQQLQHDYFQHLSNGPCTGHIAERQRGVLRCLHASCMPVDFLETV